MMPISKRTYIRNICQHKFNDFFSKKNVIGIGYGEKLTNGFYTGETCIKVLVTNKESYKELHPMHRIPSMYHGIKTDIIETGSISTSSTICKNSPMLCGSRLGPANVYTSGTAGCIVADDFNYYILSNNHVIACDNNLKLGTPILYPCLIDNGVYPNDTIAYLSKFIPIEFSNPIDKVINVVDSALAIIPDISLVDKKIAIVGSIQDLIDPQLNLSVKKFGSITKLTTGIIIVTDATLKIEFSSKKIATFKDQIVTSKMSDKGDSGSILLDSFNSAIGLLCADSKNITVYNPIQKVLEAFNVDIITEY